PSPPSTAPDARLPPSSSSDRNGCVSASLTPASRVVSAPGSAGRAPGSTCSLSSDLIDSFDVLITRDSGRGRRCYETGAGVQARCHLSPPEWQLARRFQAELLPEA